MPKVFSYLTNLLISFQLFAVLYNIHNQGRLYVGAFSPDIEDKYPMDELTMPDDFGAYHGESLKVYVSD